MSTPPKIDWNNLLDVQQEIHRWASEQFPHRTDHHAIYKLVVEEIPELMMHQKEKGMAGIGLELADCFILLMDLASIWGVDLDDAIYEKMQVNYARRWNKGANGIMQHVATPVTITPIPKMQCPSCGAEEIRETNRTDYLYQCLVCNHTFNDDCPLTMGSI